MARYAAPITSVLRGRGGRDRAISGLAAWPVKLKVSDAQPQRETLSHGDVVANEKDPF